MTEDKLNILIIEDNLADAKIICEYLFLQEGNGPHYKLEHIDRLGNAIKRLGEAVFDIILLDLGLPDSSGLGSLEKIFSVAPTVPIIVLTGLEDELTAFKALQMGAQDYLIKGHLENGILARAIRYAIERKRIQEKLSESEDHYRSLFAKNNSIMLLIDSSTGVIKDVNSAACRFYGYTRDEFLELNIGNINQLSKSELSEKLLLAYSQNQERFLFRHRMKNGEIRDVEVYSGPINKGSQKLLYSIVHDVTERRKMEEKISRINEELEQKVNERTADLQKTNQDLQNEITKRIQVESALLKSEEKYRTVSDFTYDWETWLGTDGKYIYVSPACSRISGYSVEEFIEDPSLFIRTVHPEDKPIVEKHLADVLNQRKSDCPVEFRIIRQDCQEIWIEHRCQAVYDGNGNWLGQRGTNRDISQRKRSEEEIQLLYTVTQAISETENFNEAMGVALQKICQATGWSVGEVWVPDSENKTLVFQTEFGSENDKIKEFIEESKAFRFTPGTGLPGRVWLSKEPIWIKNVSEDKDFLRRVYAKAAGLKTAIAFPVFSNKEIVAVFNFFMLTACEQNNKDLMLISAVASQLGSVIHRKSVEEKIKQSEEQYRSLFENMSEGLAYCQMIYKENKPEDFYYLNVNRAFEKLTGLHNVIGRKVSEVIPAIKTSDSKLLELFEEVSSTGRPRQFEIYLETLKQWYSISAYSPQKGYFIAIFDLITLRKEREEEIRIEKQRLNSIIKISQIPSFSEQELFDYALNESIALSSSELGYLYYYNEETEEFRLHSWSKNVMKACHINNPSTIYHLEKTGLWGEAVRQRKPIVINNYLESNPLKKGLPEGHAPLKRFMTVPVFNKGKIVAVAGVANKKDNYTEFDVQQLSLIMTAIWEIGEHKKVETELEKYRLHLECLVDERTVALKETNDLLQDEIRKQKENEEKVIAALEKEKELNELKSRFVSMISHEYRTPLTAILSSTELLELYGYKWGEEKKKEHIEKIKDSVCHMTGMLKDVLLINRAEAGRLEFCPDTLELVEFCKAMVKDIQMITRFKCVVQFKAAVENLNAFMDKKLLHYILNNLLNNAVKYSVDKGEVTLELFTEGEYVIFRVTDLGIGIPEEDKHKLFEQFYRGKNSVNIPGNGLGLSIVKRCVDLHKGEISFTSRVGKGTAFTVRLPFEICIKS